MRLNKKMKGGIVGPASCVAALGLIAAGVICPQLDKTYATGEVNATPQNVGLSFTVGRGLIDGVSDTDDIDLNFTVDRIKVDGQSASGDVDVEFEVLEYLQIDTAAGFSLNMGEVATETSSISSNFSVTGNNPNGFDIYVYANSADDTSLRGTDGNDSTVDSVSSTSGTLIGSLSNNQWGFNVKDQGTFAPATDKLFPVKIQSEATKVDGVSLNTAGTKDLTVTCGAKISGLPADTYSAEIVLAAVAPVNTALGS